MGCLPTITIDTTKKTKPLGDLFGLFFEDLNHAADGGLYGEMVQNRSFEFSEIDRRGYTPLTAWEKEGDCDLSIGTLNPLNKNNRHYLVMTGTTGEGVINTGYAGGMSLQGGQPCLFSCWARCKETIPIDISLTDGAGSPIAQATITCDGNWKRYEIELTPNATIHDAKLRVALARDGAIALDEISLFPSHTFKGRRNGLRADIAQVLWDMKPKFMRFPGGCLTHCGSLNPDDRDSMYRWKNTVGPIDARPSRRNNWGYNQSFGIGFYEYFLFCEDIGAKPLPVLPGACNPHQFLFAPLDELQPWIDDALDLIEFANGGPETKWGAVRADMGHPEPFHLEYIGIGNEEVHKAFYDRFRYFARAIRQRYPDIQIIGSGGPYPAGSEYELGWQCARETGIDLVDEHYYESPSWMIANANHYLPYPADGPKVFLGEYASRTNTYWSALCEAVYMIGLQNAPAVALACYAPMLCHREYRNWNPNLIWFDNRRVLLTANYHVQKLFMQHQGDALLGSDALELNTPEELPETPLNGMLALEADTSKVRLTGIRLEAGGEATAFPDAVINDREIVSLGKIESGEYALSMKAQRLEGERKGFRIRFGEREPGGDYVTWNIGGWENQDTIVEGHHDGHPAPLTQSQFSLVTGREYDLRLEVSGRKVKTYIDGKLWNDTEDRLPATQPLYHSASVDEGTGDIIIKAVNIRQKPIEARIVLQGLAGGPLRGVCYVLAGFAPEAINTYDDPNAVSPVQDEFCADAPDFAYMFPACSVTVLRLASPEPMKGLR